MTKQSLTDLNEYLFEQMERLNKDNLSKEETEREIAKAQAITNVADTIIKNGELALKTAVVMQKYGNKKPELPKLLTNKSGGNDGEEV